MKLFECQNCDQRLYFDNTRCENCGLILGYLPAREIITGVAAGCRDVDGTGGADRHYRYCANVMHGLHDRQGARWRRNPLKRAWRIRSYPKASGAGPISVRSGRVYIDAATCRDAPVRRKDPAAESRQILTFIETESADDAIS